jgi:Tfp pilus assembly protein PilV
VQRGFSLVETVIATGLLIAAFVTLAQLVSAGVQSGLAARTRTASALLAQQKLEELRALPWPALTSGNEPVESEGRRFVRRWSVEPAAFNAAVLIVEVTVAPEESPGHGVSLTTARAKRTP